ncbi:MAG TPA: ribosome silencing factor [Terriglobia bacterium]|nr:ribosome silencing factor [Terriglobia bacterium]
MMTPKVREAVRAAQDHKAVELNVLDLTGIGSFTDFFLICTGTSTRHVQAIADAIIEELKKAGLAPAHVEGYAEAQWILLDYLEFVVHIFSEESRHFYDLERLWKKAERVPL